MSYATGTTHYDLPLTVGTDKRDWADTNQAFSDLDAAVYGAVSDVSTAGTAITGLDTRLTTAEGNISDNAANITSLDTRLTTAEGTITTQATQISDVRADTEDMICAYNEPTATSTHAYTSGDYFIYNDVLYRATTTIGIGDTIVPDTNCTTTNVTSELLDIVSDIPDVSQLETDVNGLKAVKPKLVGTVTTDGTMTFTSVMQNLYSLWSNITEDVIKNNASLRVLSTAGNYKIFNLSWFANDTAVFTHTRQDIETNGIDTTTETYVLSATTPKVHYTNLFAPLSGSGASIAALGAEANMADLYPSGLTFSLYC